MQVEFFQLLEVYFNSMINSNSFVYANRGRYG